MTRAEALKLVEERVRTRNLVKHLRAVEAGMRALAERLGGDPERWALAGLLHDLDYDETKDQPERHGRRTVELLRGLGFADEEVLQAILAHAGHKEPETPLEIGLTAVDPLTGLIVAAALVHPQRLAGLTVQNVLNRYKEKGFARSASREDIALCRRLGLDLPAFVEVVLSAMKGIAGDLGL
ncbi:MAG: HD domain-containing protein [Candidatus Bipolaricaulota bacterium]|nr:HD domain-containing protein [Candidatus Bipolaricaulota bacterium]MCX7844458.1 HD domain-containing protein [Candidatus Bipolaricaulota bacterium]MDW8152158.1 HD domain-containing protein [Candidatus Bipolaricaulota bacterium]